MDLEKKVEVTPEEKEISAILSDEKKACRDKAIELDRLVVRMEQEWKELKKFSELYPLSLVNAEGYPRDELPIFEICEKRHRLACLETDISSARKHLEHIIFNANDKRERPLTDEEKQKAIEEYYYVTD